MQGKEGVASQQRVQSLAHIGLWTCASSEHYITNCDGISMLFQCHDTRTENISGVRYFVTNIAVPLHEALHDFHLISNLP